MGILTHAQDWWRKWIKTLNLPGTLWSQLQAGGHVWSFSWSPSEASQSGCGIKPSHSAHGEEQIDEWEQVRLIEKAGSTAARLSVWCGRKNTVSYSDFPCRISHWGPPLPHFTLSSDSVSTTKGGRWAWLNGGCKLQTAWVWTLVPPLMSWETLRGELNFPICKMGIMKGRWRKYGSARL